MANVLRKLCIDMAFLNKEPNFSAGFMMMFTGNIFGLKKTDILSPLIHGVKINPWLLGGT